MLTDREQDRATIDQTSAPACAHFRGILPYTITVLTARFHHQRAHPERTYKARRAKAPSNHDKDHGLTHPLTARLTWQLHIHPTNQWYLSAELVETNPSRKSCARFLFLRLLGLRLKRHKKKDFAHAEHSYGESTHGGAIVSAGYVVLAEVLHPFFFLFALLRHLVGILHAPTRGRGRYDSGKGSGLRVKHACLPLSYCDSATNSTCEMAPPTSSGGGGAGFSKSKANIATVLSIVMRPAIILAIAVAIRRQVVTSIIDDKVSNWEGLSAVLLNTKHKTVSSEIMQNVLDEQAIYSHVSFFSLSST